MRRALIQTGRKVNPPSDVPEQKKIEKLKVEETPVKEVDNAPMANISHVYNHVLLDEYEKYFNDDELLNDRNAKEEKARKMIALYALKNYQLEVDGEALPLLEIEIYSHTDIYQDFLLWAFKDFEKGAGPHPECLVFCIEANNNKVSGKFYLMITSIEKDGKVIEGRNEVYHAVKDTNYKVKSPDAEIAKAYDFGCNDYLYTAPRRALNFLACVNNDDLNHASKNIMAARAYSLEAHKFCDMRKIVYAYQCMRNNEGHDAVASKLKVKPQKFALWMKRFYKIPEVKDPHFFVNKEFDWSDFDQFLKAFKYFTQLI